MTRDPSRCIRCGEPRGAHTQHAPTCVYARRRPPTRDPRMLEAARAARAARVELHRAQLREQAEREGATAKEIFASERYVVTSIRSILPSVRRCIAAEIRTRIAAAVAPIFVEGTERTRGAAAAIAAVEAILGEIERGEPPSRRSAAAPPSPSPLASV